MTSMYFRNWKIDISVGKIIGLILVIGFVVWLAYNSNKPYFDPLETRYTDSLNYAGLFSESVRKHLKLHESYVSKNNDQLTRYDYGNYRLHIIKLCDIDSNSITSFITLRIAPTKQSSFIWYKLFTEKFSDFKYKFEDHPVSKINLFIDGNSTKTISSNDSLICFYSNYRELSIKYNETNETYIHASTTKWDNDKDVIKHLPISILFFKKSNVVYLIMMFPNKDQPYMKPTTLYDMLSAN